MRFTRYSNAADFLAVTQPMLERAEASNNLMLGLALNVRARPERYKIPPEFLTVHADSLDGDPLITGLRTPPANLILCAPQNDARLTSACESIVQDYMARGESLPGMSGPVEISRLFADTWTRLIGTPHRVFLNMRVYELRAVTMPPSAQFGTLRTATESDLALVVDWILGFNADALEAIPLERAREMAETKIAGREIFLWIVDDKPVAMAGKSRPTPHGIVIGLVYTPSALRGKGYASALVAKLSQQLLDEGRQFCALFTDLANPTSNSIYMKIGYKPLGDFTEYKFAQG